MSHYDCPKAPTGWYCVRPFGHPGPCAAKIRWWNLVDWFRLWRVTRR